MPQSRPQIIRVGDQDAAGALREVRQGILRRLAQDIVGILAQGRFLRCDCAAAPSLLALADGSQRLELLRHLLELPGAVQAGRIDAVEADIGPVGGADQIAKSLHDLSWKGDALREIDDRLPARIRLLAPDDAHQALNRRPALDSLLSDAGLTQHAGDHLVQLGSGERGAHVAPRPASRARGGDGRLCRAGSGLRLVDRIAHGVGDLRKLLWRSVRGE